MPCSCFLLLFVFLTEHKRVKCQISKKSESFNHPINHRGPYCDFSDTLSGSSSPHAGDSLLEEVCRMLRSVKGLSMQDNGGLPFIITRVCTDRIMAD